MAGVNKALVDLSARRHPHIVEGNKRCKFKLGVEENLVSRQDYPMLLTFGDVSVREKYQGPRASTITAIISNAIAPDMPMGIAMVQMKTRFAGLVRPSTAKAQIPLLMPEPTGKLPLASDFINAATTVEKKSKKKRKLVYRDEISSDSGSVDVETVQSKEMPQND